jgi:D-3-phosphoglycerate dehydrogenase
VKSVVLTEAVHEAGMALLNGRPDIKTTVAQGLPPAEFRSAIVSADFIGVRTFNLTPEILGWANHLEMVSKHGIGCDNIAVEHLSGRNIPVAIAADANATSVAEHAIMQMLVTAKMLLQYDKRVRAGEWDFRKQPMSGELDGRTVLIVGFGRIGQRVAAFCRAFDMRVIGYDNSISAEAIKVMGYEPAADLDAAIAETDFVNLHIPFSPSTANLFNAERLARFKPGAILINCSRGGIVDEDALVKELRSGRIAAAGVDVLKREPPPKDHPLFALPNVVLTPHSAALTREGARKMAVSMARNIIDFLDGKLSPSVVVNLKDITPPKAIAER